MNQPAHAGGHAPPSGVPTAQAPKRWSLRSRVAMLAALCVAGAVALVSIGAYVTVRGNLYDQVDSALVARASSVLNDRKVMETGGEQIPGYLFQLADVRFDLVDARGDSLLRHPGGRPPVDVPEISVAAGASSQSIRTDGGSDMRVLSVPYEYADGVALVVAQSLDDTRRSLGALAVVLFVIGGSGIVVAALAGTAVARGGLRPVERLTAATERVANTGDLRPIPVSGDDELARLTHSFNTMLAAVADAQQRQRQLVADAGHELRTPLTSLRTNLELLLAAGRSDAPELAEQDREEIENDIRAQLDELTQLIGDLSLLARADNPHAVQERVDLVEVVERALDRARRRAGDTRFDVTLQPWILAGDPNVLERAVLNLLDNAVKFSSEGGTVRVRLQAVGDGSAVLQVADSGPGIAQADLPHVFDRFYRSSEARALPGSGLGLAIVKQAAERHGGAVWAANAPEGGAVFSLRVPGAPGG
ncbi:HAMP domain-containing sensor histidine kinase [Haloechinothrix sp. LS1_15]|uniref:sensor histidine kinase n=1 Tax=Haloechinothrix sp. LS1_15 TaxID=2652248 RepID=UPI002945DB34|nr:HAMP domain-containing sensor histidine kinase [Haloechinothrix sp. LS1_15]MDV6014298.1 HAMP domain-containing histidine kinase [Haloechinothrix sp. LS1_15]